MKWQQQQSTIIWSAGKSYVLNWKTNNTTKYFGDIYHQRFLTGYTVTSVYRYQT